MIKEDKKEAIFKALEGINQNEWFKLKHVIDQYFDMEASKQAKSICITSPDKIIDFYKKLF